MDAMILGPTVERLKKFGPRVVPGSEHADRCEFVIVSNAGSIEKPEVSREVERRYHRIKGVLELAEARGSITHAQRAAGERLQAAIHGLHAVRVGSNYGDSPRGSGGGSETDRRDRCRQIIAEAKNNVGNLALYVWIYRVAENDLTAETAPCPPTLKHRAGSLPDRTLRRHYAGTLELALGRLARGWGLE